MCGHACRIEELDIGYIDGMLLLPLIQEHTIDERSPLCGHTHDSLMAVSTCSWSFTGANSPKTDKAELGSTCQELHAQLLCQPQCQQDSDEWGASPLQVHAEIVVTFEVRPCQL